MRPGLTALSLLMLGLLLVRGAHAETLRIATEGNYAPFSYLADNGSLAGFDVEIAQALCRQMRVDCEVQAIVWDKLIPSLESGQVDMIVASMARTAEREQRVAFSDYYYQSHSVFAGKAGIAADTSPGALAGLRLAIIRGTIQATFARERYPQSPLLLVAHQEEAFAMLLAGKADLVLADTINLLDFLQQPRATGYDFIGPPLLGDTLSSKAHIAVRKNDRLLSRVNRALEAIRLNGIYDRINRHYFPFSIY
ncbi:polar amino acid transport system substrate-binding protein [Geopseudomonas sagittaria]|uniref:Polar amino acid transport system substrate-binding protein n=1 Tax=Geopseudomonas sagittaria TaxID=1135990 RepID=A0A1I5UR14_9GAMM|nr:transporter substrate-binding domain-containing protein [Pseudomonas sagittaria]MCM2330235.1 transporter substrate-binding domain-containing protein [Pseudomonas sagittaria]SFP97608.1 polar amino acid transport system substrate-binding protein [Pseudomonas sagittaria]